VPIGTSGKDLVGHLTSVSPPQGTSGDGVLAVSLVRWARQLSGGALAAGAPLLFPARTAGGRSVIVGTDAAGPANNLVALKPDGSLDWQASVSKVGADVALGGAGLLYAASGAPRVCGATSGQCGTLWLVTPPANGGAATLRPCDVDAAVFGTAPAVFPVGVGNEFAVAAPTVRDPAGDNVYAFHVSSSACASLSTTLLTSGLAGETFAGVTQASQQIFVADKGGISSDGFSGTLFGTAPVNYDPSVKQAALAPPSLRGETDFKQNFPVYPGADSHVRRGPFVSPCNLVGPPCWTETWDSTAPSQVSITPVFDDKQIVASDAGGVVSAWDLNNTGVLLWQTVSPVGPFLGPVSGAVLLGPVSGGTTNPALVLDFGGRVRRLAGRASTTVPFDVLLLSTAAFASGQVPTTPVVDVLGTGGLAYLVDGAGWVWALQIDDPPLPASKGVWARPSRDSCNSRSADTACP
jgi:hypothetical protein